jgi:hypothetical protein
MTGLRAIEKKIQGKIMNKGIGMALIVVSTNLMHLYQVFPFNANFSCEQKSGGLSAA